MRKNDKKAITANIIGSMALGMSKIAANSRCAIIYHQPKLPNDVKRLRKF